MPKIPHFLPRPEPATDRNQNEAAYRQVMGALVQERAAQRQAEQAEHEARQAEWAKQAAEAEAQRDRLSAILTSSECQE